MRHSGGIHLDLPRPSLPIADRLPFRYLLSAVPAGIAAVFVTLVFLLHDLYGFEHARENYEHNAGLLQGGLFILSLLTLAVATINKRWVYALFPVWLQGNLLFSAPPVGWNARWLGMSIPDEWSVLLIKATIAIYFLLSYLLFTELFKGHLPRVSRPRLQQLALGAGLALVIAAGTLSYSQFFFIMQGGFTLGVAITLYFLTQIYVSTHSRIALWCSASVGAMLGASLLMPLSDIFDVSYYAGSLVSASAALLSGFFVVLAIAEQLRGERTHKNSSAPQDTNLANIPDADKASVGAYQAQAHRNILPKNPAYIPELRLLDVLYAEFSVQRLFLEMQPIVSLQTPCDTLNFEVLLRMRDIHGKPIPTDQIIAAAEESDVVLDLDKWVITSTLQWLHTYQNELTNTEFVCVNLSGRSLNNPAFIEDLLAILARFGTVVKLLCLEITESVALRDLKRTRTLVMQLQEMGVSVALDDFGAGYSSFSYLAELPANVLKIDGAIVQSMSENSNNVMIVQAIVTLARNLGMKCIAEWVEDSSMLAVLEKMGVDYVQGFLVATPQAPEDILDANTACCFITNEEVLAFIRGKANNGEATAFDAPQKRPMP